MRTYQSAAINQSVTTYKVSRRLLELLKDFFRTGFDLILFITKASGLVNDEDNIDLYGYIVAIQGDVC